MPVNELFREYVRCVLSEKATRSFDMEAFRHAANPRDYLNDHATFIDYGIEREVFDTGLGYVIKWSMPDVATQNKKEAELARCAKGAPVPDVFARAKDFRWIAVKKVNPIRGAQLDGKVRKITGYKDLDEFRLAIDVLTINDYIERVIRQGNITRADAPAFIDRAKHVYETNDWFRSLVDMISSCKMVGDLHQDNWGLDSQGRLKVLDPGL